MRFSAVSGSRLERSRIINQSVAEKRHSTMLTLQDCKEIVVLVQPSLNRAAQDQSTFSGHLHRHCRERQRLCRLRSHLYSPQFLVGPSSRMLITFHVVGKTMDVIGNVNARCLVNWHSHTWCPLNSHSFNANTCHPVVSVAWLNRADGLLWFDKVLYVKVL